MRLEVVDCYNYLDIKIDKARLLKSNWILLHYIIELYLALLQFYIIISKVNGWLVTFAKTHKFMDKFTSSLVYKQTMMPYFDYLHSIIS